VLPEALLIDQEVALESLLEDHPVVGITHQIAVGQGLDETASLSLHHVTRAKSPMDARRVYSAATDRSTGVISDQQVMLNGHYSAKMYPQHMRRIRFKDPESGKTLIFLTNHMALPALTIAALYKSRWQVELFFKWIKQHLLIKHFMGNSENAVKTQVWCAVATYVLIAIVKKELQFDASLYTCLQILSVSVFEKTQLSCALQADMSLADPPDAANQLNLFNF
jgi:Transposase DDE domain